MIRNQLFGESKVLVTDKASPIHSIFKEIQQSGLYTNTEHRKVKYHNNLIEQDYF